MSDADRSGREVVQLGGVEPPTSGSTDRRSNQLSYSCTNSAIWLAERHEPRSQPVIWQARSAPPFLGSTTPCFRSNAKSPGGEPRALNEQTKPRSAVQATLENTLLTLSLIGSAVSVAIFCIRAANSLDCAVIASNCLRACAVESSIMSE